MLICREWQEIRKNLNDVKFETTCLKTTHTSIGRINMHSICKDHAILPKKKKRTNKEISGKMYVVLTGNWSLFKFTNPEEPFGRKEKKRKRRKKIIMVVSKGEKVIVSEMLQVNCIWCFLFPVSYTLVQITKRVNYFLQITNIKLALTKFSHPHPHFFFSLFIFFTFLVCHELSFL